MKKVLHIFLKILLWVAGSFLLLLFCVLLLIQLPSVQNFAKKKAVNYLREKLNTPVSIDSLAVHFPKEIVLKGIYVADRRSDTLLSARTIIVDIAMFRLLRKKVQLKNIELSGITSHIRRSADSSFNFDFIANAFSSPEDATDTAQQPSAWKISLGEIRLDTISISYRDSITKNDLRLSFNHFDTRFNYFDLDKMKFSIPGIVLSGADISLSQQLLSSTDDTVTRKTDVSVNPELKLGSIFLSSVRLHYQTPAIQAGLALGAFSVDFDKTDIPGQKIDINYFKLDSTSVDVLLKKPQQAAKLSDKTAAKADSVTGKQNGTPWFLSINQLAFKNNNIRYDDESAPRLNHGVDFSHLDIQKLDIILTKFSSSGSAVSGQLQNISFSEKSGFRLDSLHTDFAYDSSEAFLKNLYVATPKSILQKSVYITYPSLAAVSKNIGLLGVDADLSGCRIAMSDVELLAPFLDTVPSFRSIRTETVLLDGKMKGAVNNLNIPFFRVTAFGKTFFSADGTIKGLPDMKTAYLNIRTSLKTTSADIHKLLPPQTPADQVRIPDNLSFTGNFQGTMQQFKVRSMLQSSDGNLALNGMLDSRRKDDEKYAAQLNVRSLNIGRVLKQSKGQLGKITMKADIDGVSLNPEKATLHVDSRVESIYFNRYLYRNFLLKGTATDGQYTAAASMEDTAVTFHLEGSASYHQHVPSIAAALTVDSIDAEALHFSKTPLRFHGKLSADFPTALIDSLNGQLTASELLLNTGNRRFNIDTISLRSVANAASDTLQLLSPVMTAEVAGSYRLSQTATVFGKFFKRYFDPSAAIRVTKVTKETSRKQDDSLHPQQFVFHAAAFTNSLTDSLLPNLKRMDTVRLTGNFDSHAAMLNTDISAPSIVYNEDTVNNLKLNIHSQDSTLYYGIHADKIQAGSAVGLNYPSVTGSIAGNKLNTTLSLKDGQQQPYYRIGGALSVSKDGYDFRLFPDSLLLAKTAWQVPDSNNVHYSDKGILFRNLSLSNGQQNLSVNSISDSAGSPVKVSFHHFAIETLAKIARQDTLLAGGIIDGNAVIDSLTGNPSFTAGIQIHDLNFKQDTIGNIDLHADNKEPGKYAVGLGLTGKENDVQLGGDYAASDGSFNMKLALRKLNIKSFEPFARGSIKESRGYLSGNLNINGTAAAPTVNGDIKTNDVGFNIPVLNSYFRLPGETVSFNDQQILFRKINILDSLNNRLTLDGTIRSQNFRNFIFDLSLNANDFRAINSTHADNPLYYGKLFMDARLRIKGNMEEPSISGTLGVNKKTDLSVVLPTENPSVEDREGVVEFINKDSLQNDLLTTIPKTDSAKTAGFRGLNASVTINIDKDAAFTVVVDERNGDVVHLKGSASLNASMDPSGNIGLTGNYEVNDGSYDLSYATVKRKFIFQKGSRIMWTGDPMSANIDLTAIYKALVPPIDLVENQLSSSDNSVYYKEKLPFNVALHMKNELMKPDLSFDILLPDSTYNVAPQVLTNVDTRLSQIRQDPNEMNKQVLGVLVLGHFIGDNPLESGAGGTSVEGLVRNSVSSLLSDQLNKLAGDLIHGVDIDFGLTSGEDYSSGTATNRTDLNVGLSKNFLNDRLTVTVGNNFNLEGAQPGEKTTDIAGDVSANYKLSKDGRYMLNAYRRDRFLVIQGEVIETGVGFTLTVDYNRFREILQKRSRKIHQSLKETRDK